MIDSSNLPSISLSHLDHLWFQVGGTLCNLTCHHCFVSCHPKNDSFGFLSLKAVRERLFEAIEFGVKEFYFTGGEPFLNPDMTEILVETLEHGPATVLTNGTVLKDSWLATLREAERRSRYSLEFRVSIDGFDAATNDPIRGEGVFDRAMQGVVKLVENGFLPIITAARTWPLEDELEVVGRFVESLKAVGYDRPRLKVLPTLQLGAEEERSHGYRESERITQEMFEALDRTELVCEHSRVVTDRGVHVCPILIESTDSLLGRTLAEAVEREFTLSQGACYTCYQYGSICSNASSGLASRIDRGNGGSRAKA